MVLFLLCLPVAAVGCATGGTRARYGSEVEKELEALQPPPTPTGIPTTFYTMQKGETLFAIARRYNTTVEELFKLNPALSNVHALPVGTVLRVPLKVLEEKAPPKEGPAPTPVSLPPEPVPSGQEYMWPVRGQVLVKFGQVLSGEPPSRSRGVEIAVQAGQEVRAARAGVAYVVRSSMPEFGNAVAIDHGNGVTSFYGYSLVIKVQNEQSVRQGQVIALASRIAPARIHFRIEHDTQPVDPLEYLPPAP